MLSFHVPVLELTIILQFIVLIRNFVVTVKKIVQKVKMKKIVRQNVNASQTRNALRFALPRLMGKMDVLVLTDISYQIMDTGKK